MPILPRAETSGSLLESLDEPSRSNHLCSESLSPLPQRAIRGDQRHLIRRVRGQVNEHVVTAASGMDDRHAINRARPDSIASFPFEDDNNRFAEPA